MNPYLYKITIWRVETDEFTGFTAIVDAFPDMIAYGDTYQEVYDFTIDAIKITYDIFIRKGIKFPDYIDIN